MAYLIILVVAVVLGGALLVVATETAGKSGKWGLNLNSVWDIAAGKGLMRKVTCPNCGREQDKRRKSMSLAEVPGGGGK